MAPPSARPSTDRLIHSSRVAGVAAVAAQALHAALEALEELSPLREPFTSLWDDLPAPSL